MPHLVFKENQQTLFVHNLRTGRTVIGRSDRSDVALPSDSVSRVHCIIDHRRDGWCLTDRSRNGTLINGAPATQTPLKDGDLVQLGVYEALFSESTNQKLAPTATFSFGQVVHEELVEVTDDQYSANRAVIHFDEGPMAGQEITLAAHTSFGGPGSNVQLDEELPKKAMSIRVVRGRAIVEPGLAAAFLAGIRVQQPTPMLPGEQIRVGGHSFTFSIRAISQKSPKQNTFGEMVGSTPVMKSLFGTMAKMAPHSYPVLLLGESGTGKELAARGMHNESPRASGPFVALNGAAISETLFESELFGHEKGAFTGATERQDGAFHRADGGTLFLDEIGEMKLDLQAKLLRVLELGEVRRVGGRKAEFPDVRVVAATNRNLLQEIKRGNFREDLYFRLDVLRVCLPPLRDRKDDIPIIAKALLQKVQPGVQLDEATEQSLKTYDWPGNIRELRNVLTRAVILTGKQVLTTSDLEFNPWSFEEPAPPPWNAKAADLDNPERQRLKQALDTTKGNRTRAAKLLGMPRSSLLYKIKKYRL